jgi:hypothetical protein
LTKNKYLIDNPASLLIGIMEEAIEPHSAIGVELFKSHYGIDKLRNYSFFKSDNVAKSVRSKSGYSVSKGKIETLAKIAENVGLTDELLLAYLKTDYEVYEPSFSIKIGTVSIQLEELLNGYQAETWAYITPFNPFSESCAYPYTVKIDWT